MKDLLLNSSYYVMNYKIVKITITFFQLKKIYNIYIFSKLYSNILI